MHANKRISDINKPNNSHISLKGNRHLLLLFVVIVLVTIVIGTAVPISHNAINNEKNTLFENSWQYSVDGENFSDVILPTGKDVPDGSNITLKNRLPKAVIKGATVLVRTSQQDVVVYVDGLQIYSSYDIEKNISAPSSAYHFVRMPTECSEKEINIVLTSPYENYKGLMNQIYIGSKASNIFFLFNQNGFRFILGFLVFSIGFLITLMFTFGKSQDNKTSIIYLGAFFICAGYWVIVESKVAQFIFPYPVALTNSSIFALTLLPVFSGLYYYRTHASVLKKMTKYIVITVTAASLLFSVMACLNPALPLCILPYYLAFMGLYVIAIFASIIFESVKGGAKISTSICGIIAFCIFCLIELVTYLLNVKDYNESNFLILGLLIFCVAMVVDSVQNFAAVYQASIQVNSLSVLAYTDSLTGLRNRTAFLENVASINLDSETNVSLVMFDLNDLKVVNDTLGHLVGDAMLRHSAKSIKSSLRQCDELFRVGGDEFVAIVKHSKDFDVNSICERIVGIVKLENEKALNYHLSIAYGCATFSTGVDKTIFSTLARADEAMYACKKIQKQNNVNETI